ncbi:MAG: hypothetical protein U0325_17845 [Polyangiales bacterium]
MPATRATTASCSILIALLRNGIARALTRATAQLERRRCTVVLVRPALFALACLTLVPSRVHAHQPPPRYAMLRPRVDYTGWLGVGGGVWVGPTQTLGVADVQLGGDATWSLGRQGDLRLGPFVEVGTASFASVQVVTGLSLFVGAIPRPLRMFLYPGEGVFMARLGAGWVLRDEAFAPVTSAPVASLTLAYGYRAPFSLREPEAMQAPEYGMRAPDRYMTGARLWVRASVDLTDAPSWQVTGGVEFDPVGGFRYLFGLY